MSGAPEASARSSAAESPIRATNQTNQTSDWRAPANISAPSGAVKAQSATADEFSKPPKLHCSAKGSGRLIANWLVRNSWKRPVRPNAQMLAAEASP